MHTLWIAIEPKGLIGWDGQPYDKHLNGAETFAAIATFARAYAVENRTHVVVTRDDFATVEERDDALSQLYDALNDAYIAEGERRVAEMLDAQEEEHWLLLAS